jgi:hypothetical protein
MSVLFRAAAVDRYRAGQAQAAIPSLVLPRPALAAVAPGALLLAVVGLAAFSHIPVYVPGSAVLIHGSPTEPNGTYAAALLPAESLPRLQSGQPVYLDIGTDGSRLRTAIVEIEPEVISPDAIAERLRLGAMGSRSVMLFSGPVAVAYAPLETSNAADYVGAVVPVKVEIDRRSYLALMAGDS